MISDRIRYSNIDPDQEIQRRIVPNRRQRNAEAEPVAVGRSLWRLRRSSQDAPPTRADRNSWGRVCHRKPDIRSIAAPAPVEQKPELHCIDQRPRRSPSAARRSASEAAARADCLKLLIKSISSDVAAPSPVRSEITFSQSPGRPASRRHGGCRRQPGPMVAAISPPTAQFVQVPLIALDGRADRVRPVQRFRPLSPRCFGERAQIGYLFALTPVPSTARRSQPDWVRQRSDAARSSIASSEACG